MNSQLQQEETEESSTSQAGWMFADMLIALTVIFLASIGFINQFSIEASLESQATSASPADNLEPETDQPVTGTGSRECQYRDTYRFQLEGLYSYSSHPELRSDLEEFYNEFSQDCAQMVLIEIACQAGKKASDPTSVPENQCFDFSNEVGREANVLGILGPNGLSGGWEPSLNYDPDLVRVRLTFGLADD